MKFDREVAAAAIKILELVGTHAGLLSSQFIRITYQKNRIYMNLTGLSLASCNFPVTASTSEAPWTFFIDRRVWSTFVNTTAAKTIDLDVDKTRMLLKAGRHKVVAPGMSPVAGYASWKKGTITPVKIADNLKKELKILADYAPITAAADHLSATYFVEGYGVIGTDGFIMAALFDSKISVTFPLPVVFAQTLASKEMESFEIDENGAGLRFPEGYCYQAVSTKCLTDYPLEKIKEVLSKGAKAATQITVPAEVLLHGLQYVNSFIFGAATDYFVDFSGKVGEPAKLQMTSPHGQEISQVLSKGDTVKDFSFRWPVDKVLSWVTHIASFPDREVLCSYLDGNSILLSKDGARKNLLMIADHA